MWAGNLVLCLSLLQLSIQWEATNGTQQMILSAFANESRHAESTKGTQLLSEGNTNTRCPINGSLPGTDGGAPIQFVSIPKTGTSGLRNYIAMKATQRDIYFQNHDGPFPSNNFWEHRARIVMGHRFYGWAPGFLELKPLIVAVFREPIAFAVSLFDYMESARRWTHAADVTARIVPKIHGRLSMSENIEAGNLAVLGTVRDKQSIFLFANYCDCCAPGESANIPKELAEDGEIKYRFAYMQTYLGTYDFGGSLKCALRVLHALDCVGTLGNIRDFMIQLRWKTGWLGYPALMPHHNSHQKIGKNRSILTTKARLILEQEAEKGIDLHVYREAVQINNEKTRKAKKCLGL